MTIPTHDLTLDDVPTADAPAGAVICFAQTLNGYEAVGGDVHALAASVARAEAQPLAALSLEDLRLLLFARQRAHYYEGGGWGGDDPILDEMRMLTALIRKRLEAPGG